MATPNIVSVATINGSVTAGAIVTGGTVVVDVSAEYIYKINNILRNSVRTKLLAKC